MLCLAVLIFWETPVMKKMSWTKIIPGPLIAVILGIGINEIYHSTAPELYLTGIHMVQLPVPESFSEFTSNLKFPDIRSITNPEIYVVAVTIAIVASLETLLSLDAVDKLDPYKRIAPQSKELKAQGIGNLVSGLLGGLPLTSVIVRSSANVSSGGRTKVSTIFHGILLFSAVIFFPGIMNLIPLSALAAILLVVGYKLTKPSLYRQMFNKGLNQFIPYASTILAILLTDLLIGICIGIVIGLFYVIKTNFRQSINITQDGNNFLLRLNKDVTFLNKAVLRHKMENIPENAYVIIDGTKAGFIDQDILEAIDDFQDYAKFKNITIEIKRSAGSQNILYNEISRS
jgi:MFS superfamily sulfate permease-like transporter